MVSKCFAQSIATLASSDENHHHSALLTLLQISDIVDRADLRSDLLQELARQKLVMETLRGNPVIAPNKLDNLVSDLNTAEASLREENTKLGQTLRTNEWLMAIKQRTGIPGGVCEFDVPSYHFWLNLGVERRKQDLLSWIQPLMPMYQAILVILKILRGQWRHPKKKWPQMACIKKCLQVLSLPKCYG